VWQVPAPMLRRTYMTVLFTETRLCFSALTPIRGNQRLRSSLSNGEMRLRWLAFRSCISAVQGQNTPRPPSKTTRLLRFDP
jgi:hypothetical protein